jgi:hypothetical protein
MAKSKVTVDIMHGKERTSTGKITSAKLVAQHFRAIFCNVRITKVKRRVHFSIYNI